MTPELMEFRKWNVVAGLVEKLSEGNLIPVVINTEGIAMLVTHGDKAFFFSSSPDGKIIDWEAWFADTNQIISAGLLFPSGMPDCVTFREITHLVIAKVLS